MIKGEIWQLQTMQTPNPPGQNNCNDRSGWSRSSADGKWGLQDLQTHSSNPELPQLPFPNLCISAHRVQDTPAKEKSHEETPRQKVLYIDGGHC